MIYFLNIIITNHPKNEMKRVNCTDKFQLFVDQLPFILPDYMLVFAVPVLAHDPAFTSHTDIQQLKVIQQCLWFILEPLLVKNEFYSYGFYKSLVEKMKNCKDSLRPDDENMNCVSKSSELERKRNNDEMLMNGQLSFVCFLL